MKFNIELKFVIGNNKYIFRTLMSDDVSIPYINSLKEVREMNENISEDISIENQKNYIREILKSPNRTICGLFLDNHLIGTAGIQNLMENRPIKVVGGYTSNCTIGILVLSKASRGKGYGKSLVWSSCLLADKCYGVKVFEACMKRKNFPSLKSFLACGFNIKKESTNSINVELKIEDLVKPQFIDDVNNKL